MQRQDYRRYGIRKKRRNFSAWALLAVALVLVLVLLGILLFAPGEEAQFGEELKRLDIPVQSTLVPFSGGSVYIDTDTKNLYYLNQNGEAKWGFSGTVEGMKTAVSSSRLAVYYSSKLQMIDQNGSLLYSKVYDYPIQDLKLTDRICAFLQYHGTAKNVTVVNAAGEKIDLLTEPDGQQLVDFGVFSTAGVWVITVDLASVQPVYRFYTYRYDNNKLITVSYTTSEQLIYYPVFYEDCILLVGTGDVVSIDYTGKFLRRIRCNGYELAHGDMPYTASALMMRPVGRECKEVFCINSAFDSFVLSLQEPILQTAMTDRYYYVFTANHLYTYAVGNMARKCYTLPGTAERVLVGAEDQVLLQSAQGCYLLALK